MNPLRVEVLPRGGGDPAPQDDVALNLRSPQIEVPVLQPDVFRDLLARIEREGGRFRFVEDFQRIDHHLDLAGGQLRVFHSLRAFANRSFNGEDVFAADAVGLLMGIGLGLRVEDDLDDAFAVAQVDEDDAAVVAAAMHPAHQDHFFSCVVRLQVPAVDEFF